MENKKIILSGIQPSGNLMIGNYLGALKHWVSLQDKYNCFYVLVDLHAITVKQEPSLLRKRCYDFISLYIACGINPEKSTIFIQSHVPAHAQLAWVLNCFTQIGDLNRMTQFKDKSKKNKKNINAGLFTYPVLMAADILLYQADLVPVGEDQKQHLELTRNLAQKFNNQYSQTFKIPEPYIPPIGARIMSLQQPEKKMSKSDNNANNYISLLDNSDIIRAKIKKAVTDSQKTIKYDKSRPGISNLITIYSTITSKSFEEIESMYENKDYKEFKEELAEIIIELLKPIQDEYNRIRKDKAYLEKTLKAGAEKANYIANKTLYKVYRKIGFVNK